MRNHEIQNLASLGRKAPLKIPRELWILGVVNCGGNDDADDGEFGLLAAVGDSLGLS